ncbi:MAG: methyltransferase domain-containing protein [candidate division SR1 bacterium]|nr:methyltransferase domain-containing protein [candidate division SR1 bacterium]
MLVKIILLSILLGIIVFLVVRYHVQLFLLLFRRRNEAIYLPSFTKHLSLMRSQLPLSPGKKILDLGCGDGKALRFFARHYGLNCQGYDINTFAIRYGRLINRIQGYKMKLVLKDFKHAPIGDTDYIYLYLFPGQMVSIEDWVFSGVKEGTILISTTFHFKKHIPFQIIKDRKGRDRIYLYRK